ncbi:ParB/RepB/Spo0J family partition protein [Methylocystis parvus]|uniref:ParB/RepB/Spo0J family partition protein n=1 Tax=Methylocystis parvus TaxID=134 RepID=UPI003C78DC6C
MMDKYKSHWAADLFPLLEGEAFSALVEDIRDKGLREPIIRTADGDRGWVILDGRNRLRACEAAGVDPYFEEYEGDDPLGFVLSANLHRRHLNESQRALAAAKLQNCANLRKKISQEEAAKMFNVSRRLVTDAAKILKHGTSKITAEIESGRMAVSWAVTLIKDPARSACNYAKKASEPAAHGTARRAAAKPADDAEPAEGPEQGDASADAADKPLEPADEPVAKPATKQKKLKAQPKKAQGKRDEEAYERQLDNSANHGDADALRAELTRANAEVARVNHQLELYRDDGIVLDPKADAATIAETIRAGLGDAKARAVADAIASPERDAA